MAGAVVAAPAIAGRQVAPIRPTAAEAARIAATRLNSILDMEFLTFLVSACRFSAAPAWAAHRADVLA